MFDIVWWGVSSQPRLIPRRSTQTAHLPVAQQHHPGPCRAPIRPRWSLRPPGRWTHHHPDRPSPAGKIQNSQLGDIGWSISRCFCKPRTIPLAGFWSRCRCELYGMHGWLLATNAKGDDHLSELGISARFPERFRPSTWCKELSKFWISLMLITTARELCRTPRNKTNKL